MTHFSLGSNLEDPLVNLLELMDFLEGHEIRCVWICGYSVREHPLANSLCPECSFKLNHHHKRKEVTVKKRRRSKENVDKSLSKTSKSSRKHKRKHKKRRKEYSSSSSEESQGSDKDAEGGEEEEEGPSESDHWRGPAPTVEEKSREEEFDEYFEDMFL
ncbi:protein FRA10AC1-like [Sinocyclocheilus grahami]|uniref:protein FRA10AC1-like n=1 Tax=Sinocyclocheilus grahami TaxID=75366 RepID=UPI0007AD3330|nr:PREDICTED: protein FRA10AC1-like [Sinocyclocheilus grahami]